jgi:hypothetical protein
LSRINVIDGGPDTVRGGIVIGGDDDHTSSDNRIERNVIAYAADYGIYSNWQGRTGSGNVARYNCVWGAGTANIDAGDGLVASGNVTADPRFLDRDDRDYRLAAAALREDARLRRGGCDQEGTPAALSGGGAAADRLSSPRPRWAAERRPVPWRISLTYARAVTALEVAVWPSASSALAATVLVP